MAKLPTRPPQPYDAKPENCLLVDLGFAISRRQFLSAAGASLVALTIPGLGPEGAGHVMQALFASYPRKKVAQVSQLKLHQPVEFRYPYDHPFSLNYLVKLGTAAGGGAGAEHDIVAFNTLCAHQGGPLTGRYNARYQTLGPCPFHLTTFDLTRHGMVISGHATQGLPQVTLEVEGDDIYATGVLGLIYGYHDNTVAPA